MNSDQTYGLRKTLEKTYKTPTFKLSVKSVKLYYFARSVFNE